nr:HAMP domain-containing sensor histidine kinase [Nocardia transvalensis]
MLSLRARVAFASAATAALVVAAMSAIFFALAPSGAEQQVDSVVRALRITGPGPPAPGPRVIIRAGPIPGPGALPEPWGDGPPLPAGPDVTWTVPAEVGHGDTVMMAATVPRNTLADTVSQQRTRILTVGLAAIVLAAGLGWFFAHRAVVPLRRLTTAAKGAETRLSLEVPGRSSTTETAELTAAMNQMLERIAEERRHTADALAAARDFAATSAHELRTPLTAMRTDLQVLRSMPVGDREREQILDEVLTTQQSVEDTLAALERLALGELTTAADFDEVDLDEIIDQALEDARRVHPEVVVESAVTEPVRMRGLAAGLRSILDNAIANSVRHGQATRVIIDARTSDDGIVTLTVDDNGRGVPPADRERVFERFRRGDTAATGSGLGLALVAQQAGLHGGSAVLEESPLGDTRLHVRLATGVGRPTDQ